MVTICRDLLRHQGYVATATDEKVGGMVREYYLDPEIPFVKAGEGEDFRGGPVDAAGYYIYPFCAPGCCRPWGPFKTVEEARAWSLKNLPELS